MFSKIKAWAIKLAETEPFTLAAQQVLRHTSTTAMTRVRWNIAERVHYLLGVFKAAKQAANEGIQEISVIEFGVASGAGLVALERSARDVEAETQIRIKVFGFDSGGGLPKSCGDYRDHPDFWTPSDYPMDVDALKAKLADRTKLMLGDVATTVPDFIANDHPPVGFISYDLDYYSSTRHALQILSSPDRKSLRRVFLYFDDVDSDINHRFAGELLAIDEFNTIHEDVKIDQWRGVSRYSLFSHPLWLRRMYIAHDLQAISATVPKRAPLRL
jgi:hypothetical protein